MTLFNKNRRPILSDLPKPNFEIPNFSENTKKEGFPEYKPIIPNFSSIKSEVNKFQEKPLFEEQEEQEEQPKQQQPQIGEDTDLFVKIDKYEQAMRILESIKDGFKRTEDILKNLQTIKQKEDREITTWNSQIQKLKEKVVSVDSVLFESKKR